MAWIVNTQRDYRCHMESQKSIAGVATLSGRGLFTGRPARVRFRPATMNQGVVFVREDLGGAEIPALVTHVVSRPRRTALACGEASIETCEHVLSAIAALGIDNVVVEVDGPELPAMDGSAKPFVDVLLDAGIVDCGGEKRPFVVSRPTVVREGDALVAALPSEKPMMQLVYELDYGDEKPLGRQLKVFDLANGAYIDQIAPARTFVLESEAIALRQQGLGTHLTPGDLLVIGDRGPVGDNALRFEDEPVRHKIVDLIGDLALLGAPIHGKIVAYKSGHRLNHRLARELLTQLEARKRHDLTLRENTLDVRKLLKIIPHRYPMMLIDRVVEIEGNDRAVGIKNVTMNEPFFQGHYPGVPIMPGVLIVEAMAQLGGVLVGQNLQHTGKLAVLLSLDRVKLRKPVTPGDQLILEARSIRVRTRIAHVRCKAYVGEEVAAEAEIKFMLVDDEQE